MMFSKLSHGLHGKLSTMLRQETGPEEGGMTKERWITKANFWNKSEVRISEVRPSWSSQCLRRWLRWALTGAK